MGLVCLTALSAACAGRGGGAALAPLPATADTGVVAIDGPVLIGFSPPPTVGALADSATARWYEAFHTGLERLRAEVEPVGVRVYEQYTDTIAVRESAGGVQIYVPAASSGFGYYLAAPGRAPEILEGLQSEAALRDALWRYFHAHGPRRQAAR